MKRFLPSRRFLKWTGLVAAIIIGTLWGVSVPLSVYRHDLRSGLRLAYCTLGQGCIAFEVLDPEPVRTWAAPTPLPLHPYWGVWRSGLGPEWLPGAELGRNPLILRI